MPSTSSIVAKADLLQLFKRLLRACQTYPSINRDKLYISIREDFKQNMTLDPGSEKVKQQLQIAYKGLSQLHQFDNRIAANFSVNLEQNPFPKPENYDDKRSRVIDQVLSEKK